jgi:hypothetical protein
MKQVAKRAKCEVLEIPWPAGSKEHQDGIHLIPRGEIKLGKALKDKLGPVL